MNDNPQWHLRIATRGVSNQAVAWVRRANFYSETNDYSQQFSYFTDTTTEISIANIPYTFYHR